MAQQTINIGSSASDGTGDELRVAFDKINDNFTELYATSEYGGLTYANLAVGATSGSGTGARFTVSRFANSYTVDLVSGFAGTGYAASDTITIFGNVLGGTSSVNDVTITVATLANATVGNIATVTSVGAPANPVLSVNGQTGDVTLTVNNIDNAASKGYVTNAITGNVNVLTANIASTNANVTAANSAISTHTTQISTLDANVGTLWGNVGTLSATKATISYVDTSINNALSSNAVLANVNTINANVAAANIEIDALRANITAANSMIDIWRANLGTVVGTTIPAIDANMAAANSTISSNTTRVAAVELDVTQLYSNAGTQASSISVLQANALTQHNSIRTLDANLGTKSDLITALQTNTATTVNEVNNLRANITAANAAIASNDSDIQTLDANLGARSTTIITLDANLGTVSTSLNSLTANAATQAGELATLTSNAATQADSLATLTSNSVTQHTQIRTLDANVGSQSLELSRIDANIGQNYANVDSVNSNVTAVNVTIASLDANIGSFQTYANTEITTLDANVGYIRTNYANTATSATFTGNVSAPYVLASANVKVDGGIEVGVSPEEDFPGQGGFFGGNVDSYYQVIVQNFSNSSSASTDLVLNADDATDTNNYINIGINSSNWVGTFADSGIEEYPHDGYFATVGGNTAIESTANISLVANTSVITLIQDGNLKLFGQGIIFGSGNTQVEAYTGPPWEYVDANTGAIFSRTTTNEGRIDVIDANVGVIVDTTIPTIDANVGAYQIYANANIGTATTNITTLDANLGTATTNITTLDANLGTATTNIDSINANIGAFQTWANTDHDYDSLDANVGAYQSWANTQITTLDSNLGTATTNISTLDANLGTATTNITTLDANVGTKTTEIVDLRANIEAANVAISAIDFSALTDTNANVTAANAAISSLEANVGTIVSVTIPGFDSNLGTTYSTLTGLDANVGFYVPAHDANIGTIVSTTIPNLNANIGAFQTYANVEFSNVQSISSDVIPSSNIGGNIGSVAKGWDNAIVYTSLRLGDHTLTASDGNLYINGDAIGDGTYGNTQVAEYLPAHTGAVAGTTGTFSGNVSADNLVNTSVDYTMGNATHWTTPVSNVAVALDQLAERIYNLENP